MLAKCAELELKFSLLSILIGLCTVLLRYTLLQCSCIVAESAGSLSNLRYEVVLVHSEVQFRNSHTC